MTVDQRILIARSGQAVEGADALALVTEWHEFRRPDFQRIKRLMKTASLFDEAEVIVRRGE